MVPMNTLEWQQRKYKYEEQTSGHSGERRGWDEW